MTTATIAFQKTQLQPPVGPSVDSLCHPWFTTTNLFYRFPIFETSATALRGTIGRYWERPWRWVTYHPYLGDFGWMNIYFHHPFVKTMVGSRSKWPGFLMFVKGFPSPKDAVSTYPNALHHSYRFLSFSAIRTPRRHCHSGRANPAGAHRGGGMRRLNSWRRVVVPGQSQQLGPEKKLAISGRVSEVSTTCKVYVRGKGLCPENMALYGPSTLGSWNSNFEVIVSMPKLVVGFANIFWSYDFDDMGFKPWFRRFTWAFWEMRVANRIGTGSDLDREHVASQMALYILTPNCTLPIRSRFGSDPPPTTPNQC